MTARYSPPEVLLLFITFSLSLFTIGLWLAYLYEQGLSCQQVLMRWAVLDLGLCIAWLALAYWLGES